MCYIHSTLIYILHKNLLYFHITGIMTVIQSSAFWNDVLVQNLHIPQVCLGFWKQ